MGVNFTVDYEKFPSIAADLRTKGGNVYDKIDSAYKFVGGLHTEWYGKRYNTLVDAFNKIIPDFNKMLELINAEIPDALDNIAKNYASADTSSVGKKIKTVAKTFKNIEKSKEIGLKFNKELVEKYQKNVSDCFNKAKEIMEEYEKVFNKIKWTGNAAETFRTRFIDAKKNVISAFTEINSQFSKSMNATISDMSAAETSNTLS